MQCLAILFLGACAAILPLTGASADKGRLVLTFDDTASASSWIAARQVFRDHGAHATFFFDGDISASATKAAISTLAGDGHTIGFHGYTSGKKVTELVTDVSQATAYFEAQVRPMKAVTDALGVKVNCFAYPSSARNETTDKVLLRFFNRLRSGQNSGRDPATAPLDGVDAAFIASDALATTPVIMGNWIPTANAKLVDDVCGALERAQGEGSALCLYSHAIEDSDSQTAADSHNMTVAQLTAILDKAVALGLDIVGFDELPSVVKSGYSFAAEAVFPGYDGTTCKVQPKIATDGANSFLFYQKLLLGGSDVFTGQYIAKSTDGGQTWGTPKLSTVMVDTTERGKRVSHYAQIIHYSRRYHKWLCFGNTTMYNDNNGAYQVYENGEPYAWPLWMAFDSATGDFTSCQKLSFPLDYELAMPFDGVVELDNGHILLPFYYRPIGAGKCSRPIVVEYDVSGETPTVVQAGSAVDVTGHARGFGEPSIVRFGGKYYMTIRSDEFGAWCESADGLNWSAPVKWTWSDGTDLGNANTQQHWLLIGDELYLAYTRVTADNGNVFRNRAPIFVAKVDLAAKGLVRTTEKAVVPNRGARLGNYCVSEGPDGNPWLVTAEWMQGVNGQTLQPGAVAADNSIWVVRFAPEFEAADKEPAEEDEPKGPVFYVATNGLDTRDGRSVDTAVKTPTRALELATAAGGGTIYLMDGEYTSDSNALRTGLAIKWVGYSGDPTKVTVRGAGTIRPFLVSYDGSEEFEIRNITIVGGQLAGTSGGSAVNLQRGRIANCIIKGAVSGNSALFLTGRGIVENTLIYGNAVNYEVELRYYADYPGTHALVNCTVVASGSKKPIYYNGTAYVAATSKPQVINSFVGGGTNPDDATKALLKTYSHNCAGDFAISGASDWVQTTCAKAFDSGYCPQTGSPLVNAGSKEKYDLFATGAKDLAGNPRFVGNCIDIGCFASGIPPTVGRVSVSHAVAPIGFEVGFTYSGACDVGGVSWQFDDGGKAEGTTVSHAFATPGRHVVRVTVSLQGEKTLRSAAVKVIVTEPNALFVSNDGNDSASGTMSAPLLTIGTAADKLINVKQTGGTIYLFDGEYTTVAQITPGTLPIRIYGLSMDPTKVVVKGAPYLKDQLITDRFFGNFTTGSSDCEIGYLTLEGYRADSYKTRAGAVAVLSHGRMFNCVIRWNSHLSVGGGTYVGKHAGIIDLRDDAVIENCLFYGNSAVGMTEAIFVDVDGNVPNPAPRIVNCTFLTQDYPAIFCQDDFPANALKVVNCAMFGATSPKPLTGYALEACVCCAGDFSNATDSGWVRTTFAAAYESAENWNPVKEGPLVNAGPTLATAVSNGARSQEDLFGNKRRRGGRLDIGCVERDLVGFVILLK